jgi:hypothetical protein
VNRMALAMRIAQAISVKLSIPIGEMPPEALLEEVDRQRHVQSRYSD